MKQYPLVTVIIPTKNEQTNILRCLKSLRNQKYPGRIEVIVVDNFSTDNTLGIAQEYLKQQAAFFGSYQVLSSGPERSSQRNLGAKLAKGRYLLFLDADMEATSRVVNECVALAIASISPPIIVVSERSIGSTFWGQALALEKNCYKDLNIMQAARFFPENVFRQFGGYDPELRAGEDWELSQRLAAKGVPILMTETSKLHHYEPTTSLWEMFKKEAYYIKYMDLYVAKQPGAFSYQGSIIYRGLIYARAWKDLVAHPFKTTSFLSYKIVVWLMWQHHRRSDSMSFGVKRK